MAGETRKLRDSSRIRTTAITMAAKVSAFRYKAEKMQGREDSKQQGSSSNKPVFESKAMGLDSTAFEVPNEAKNQRNVAEHKGEKEKNDNITSVGVEGNDKDKSKERALRKNQKKRSIKGRLMKKATETKGPKLDGSLSDSGSGYETGAQSDTSSKSKSNPANKTGSNLDGSKSDAGSGYDSGAQSDTGGQSDNGGQSDPGGQSDGSSKSNSNPTTNPGSGYESGAQSDSNSNSNSNSNSGSKAKSHSGGKKNKGKKKGIEQKKEGRYIQHKGKKKELKKKEEEGSLQQMTAEGRKERNIGKRNAPASRL